jgi:hypothetical protein
VEDAKEDKSFTAEGAKAAKENNSFITKAAEGAKRTIIRTQSQERQGNAK